MDHIYNITAKEEDYVNPTTEGIMDWKCDSSCMTDSDEGLDNWQNRLYELHGHQCARITKSLRWLGSQTRFLPTFDGLREPKEFIVQFLEQVLDSQKMQTLDSVFRAIAARGWNGHKKYIQSWEACQKLLCLRFMDQPQEVRSRFNGQTGTFGAVL